MPPVFHFLIKQPNFYMCGAAYFGHFTQVFSRNTWVVQFLYQFTDIWATTNDTPKNTFCVHIFPVILHGNLNTDLVGPMRLLGFPFEKLSVDALCV